MSSFMCEKCGKAMIDTPGGNYKTECPHHPKQKPQGPFDYKACDELEGLGELYTKKFKDMDQKNQEEWQKEFRDLWHTAGKFEAKKEIKEKIKEIIKLNRDNWALSLTYLADEKIDNQFEASRAHLDIIMDGLISYIDKI